MQNNIMVESITELIEKFRPSGYGIVLEHWFERYKNERNDMAYGQLYGFLWALEAVGTISEECSRLLIQNLIYINNHAHDSEGNMFWVDDTGRRHYTGDHAYDNDGNEFWADDAKQNIM